MNKNIFFFIILISLILLYKCVEDNDNKKPPEDDYDDEEEEDSYAPFRKTLRKYLKRNKLFKSSRLVEPVELKRIFLDVVGDGGVQGTPKRVVEVFDKLADFFVDKYYEEKKQIKGKEVYKLFNFGDISMKLGELMREMPPEDDPMDKDDEFDNNYGYMDDL